MYTIPDYSAAEMKRLSDTSKMLYQGTLNVSTEVFHEFTVCSAVVIQFLPISAGSGRGFSRAANE